MTPSALLTGPILRLGKRARKSCVPQASAATDPSRAELIGKCYPLLARRRSSRALPRCSVTSALRELRVALLERLMDAAMLPVVLGDHVGVRICSFIASHWACRRTLLICL